MNLKDRMKSESPSSVPSVALSTTTQELNQSSREQQLLEQALTKIQNLETTLEQTQKEDHETIQQLSSENSVLRKELQKKSETIVSLNGQIEKLHGSDLVLKRNEELEKQNKELQESEQRTKNEVKEAIALVKTRATALEQEITQRLDNAKKSEQEAIDLKADIQAQIGKSAEHLAKITTDRIKKDYKNKIAEAEHSYKKKTATVYTLTAGALIYSFLATMLTACNSKRCISDIAQFVGFIYKLLATPIKFAIKLAEDAWTVKDMIPYSGLDVIAGVLLAGMLIFAVFYLAYGSSGYCIYRFCKFYYKEFTDIISGVVALVSMAFLVWFADDLTILTWNIIAVWFLIHGLYMIIRMYITTSKGSYY